MPDKSILIVEDEADTRQVLTHVLVAEGYSVDAVGTVAEAWHRLDQRPYTLVIVDWRLPDGDGLVIADAAAGRGAATFVMSGYLFRMPGGTADRHETLMKPLRPSEIIAVTERRIGKAGVVEPK